MTGWRNRRPNHHAGERSRRTSHVFAVLAVLGLAAASVVGVTSSASATKPKPQHKVTICHRTDSETNPYVKITVDVAAVDGNTANDHGRGDHLAEHTGNVWFPGHAKEPKWGDIIPPFYSDGTPDGLPSLNWNADGQAIFNNGCKPANTPPPPPPTTVAIPAQPGVTDGCGPNNAHWNVPADTDTLNWILQDTGDLSVTIVKEGVTFTDGSTSHDYGTAPDSNVACPTAKCPAGTEWIDGNHNGVVDQGECATHVVVCTHGKHMGHHGHCVPPVRHYRHHGHKHHGGTTPPPSTVPPAPVTSTTGFETPTTADTGVGTSVTTASNGWSRVPIGAGLAILIGLVLFLRRRGEAS